MKRYLCYQHHCHEFDKLPNCRRGEAAEWQTVDDPALCDLCPKPAWLIVRWTRLHWSREDGRQAYRGYFIEEGAPGHMEYTCSIFFWARRPVRAMKQIARSGRHPAAFGQQTVN